MAVFWIAEERQVVRTGRLQRGEPFNLEFGITHQFGLNLTRQ